MFGEGKEENDTGKHRFSLCCILNLHVLSNIMLPSMCTSPLCAVNCITYEKRKKKISPRFKKKKKEKRKSGIYGLAQVVQRRLSSRWGEGCWTLRCWERGFHTGGSNGGEKKSHPCVKMQLFTASTVRSLNVWQSSFRSCLLLSVMFSSQQSES